MADNAVATQAAPTVPVVITSTPAQQSQPDILNMSLSPSSTSFLAQLPHLMPSRRNRTLSACERASDAPELQGKITHFCREKGHGFVAPLDPPEVETDDKIFVHVSDIDCDIVPQVGDVVIYKPIQIPPKMQKRQATHVKIIKFNGERHYTWEGHVVSEEV